NNPTKKLPNREAAMGLYFEEFSVGQKIVTEKRTILESDIMTFAALTGDNNRIHTDPEFSKTTVFGRQVAHGLLGLSIASGLAWRTGILDGTVIAFREINEWKFIKPVFIGDDIYVELDVRETKALPRIGGGSVTIVLEVKNQNEEVTHRGSWTVLIMSKPK
ncbi:MAG: MaoC/PaaZ C-terminal domain-containing protein, partial [Chloroflexota bacterium]|nr:MaoC/PaaZ C-terminal domain-containing protein [Anaerolineales bacterium]